MMIFYARIRIETSNRFKETRIKDYLTSKIF